MNTPCLLPPPNLIGAPDHSRIWRQKPCFPYPLKSRTSDGYGLYRLPDGKGVLAHRMSWEEHFGPIPAGLFVCHHCDNPECVEPTHLFLGTVLDNNRDRHQKGRSRGGRLCGDQNPRSRLTREQVEEIRALPCIRRRDHKVLEAHYGVGVRHLYDIRADRSYWK